MAVTHADLEPNTGKTCLMISKTGVFLVLVTILLGLSSFTLCLIAEATRSQVTWMNTRKTECVYRSSGKTPLLVNHRQPYFSWILNPLLPTLSLPCWIFLHHYLVTTISMDKHELKLDFKRFWEEFRSSSSEKEKEALVSYH
ncbi:hypothetical protein S245_044551, partial [Arachis hypogaea]